MDYFIKTSALITLFYISYKVFLHRETFFNANRWFLMLGLLTSVLLPLIVVPNYIYVEPVVITPQEFYVYETVATQPLETLFDWMKWLSFVYFAGVSFFFIKWLISFTSLMLILKNNSIQKVGSYYMMETDKQTAPFSFFKWIAYNPSQFTEDELQLIINHERVHAKEWHSVDIILSQLFTILFWFNPFIWFYKKDLQQNLEFIADQKAQQTSSCHKHYQKLLLKTSLPHQQLAITNNFYNSLIKKRIVMLHKSKSSILNIWKYALVLPALVIFMMSFNTKDIFIEKPAASTPQIFEQIDEHSTKEPIINKDLTITKDMTDAELENIKATLKEKGFEATFKNIVRNSKGQITSIKVDISSKNSNANYHIKGDKSILPIKISINEDDNSIGISSISAKKDKQVIQIQNDEDVDVIDKSGKKSVHVNGKVIYADTIIEKDVKKVVLTDDEGKKVRIIALENGNKNVYAYSINGDKPMVIVDGKAIVENELDVNPEIIESVTVLKDKNAVDKYGDDGKNGVIEIETNSSKPKYSYSINKITFNDDEDTSKNAKLLYITNESTNSEFDEHKDKLKSMGITADYSKIKRDKSGKIVNIKISLKNNSGQKSSAVYQDSNGISNIRYGIVEGKLVIQSAK